MILDKFWFSAYLLLVLAGLNSLSVRNAGRGHFESRRARRSVSLRRPTDDFPDCRRSPLPFSAGRCPRLSKVPRMKIVLALLALPACSLFHPAAGEGSTTEAAPPAYTRNALAGTRMTPAQRASCEGVGGSIQLGPALIEYCVQPFADAGKACSGNADCLGECRYQYHAEEVSGASVTGKCQFTDAWFGCYSTVENGRIAHTLCVD